MSREVEVKNIQMTASVPEDIQISLGKLTDIKTSVAAANTGNPSAAEISTGSTYVGLSGNQGKLAGSADNGAAQAPANDDSAVDNLFWANTADISEYYRLGKIIPASSTNGGDIFFTPDASGDGTSLKASAKFYQAAALNSADFSTENLYKWNDASKKFTTDGTGDPARTTLHAITAVNEADDKWNPGAEETGDNSYRSAESWYKTNDDGYYVDIPVWIRSSSKTQVTLSVDAFVTTNAGKTDDGATENDDELYMAARAAIIYASDVANPTTVNTSSNLLSIRKDTFATVKSIIDYMYTTNNSGDAVSGLDTDGFTGKYGTASEYDGAAIIKVPARDAVNTTKKYGDMVKAVVRVWLEGEDPNCWNPNAGQDFNISLKFVKGAITTGLEENASGYAYPTPYAAGDKKNADKVDVASDMVVTIKETINGQANTEIKFTFDGNKWNQTTGSVEILDGKTYTISGEGKTSQTVTGAAGIANWLKDNVTTKADLAIEYTITATTPTPDPGN